MYVITLFEITFHLFDNMIHCIFENYSFLRCVMYSLLLHNCYYLVYYAHIAYDILLHRI